MNKVEFIPMLITTIITVIALQYSSISLMPVNFKHTDFLLALFLPFGIYQFTRVVKHCVDWYNSPK